MFGLLGKSTTLKNGLIAYYNFDEASGNLLDQVNSYDGTVVGATQNVTGKIGTAYSFDGVNDYVSLGDQSVFSFGNGTTDIEFSVSAWIYVDSFSTNNPIVSKYRDVFASDGEWTFVVHTDGDISLSLIDNLVANREVARSSTSVISSAQWYHVVATYSGIGGSTASSGIKLYVNSSEVSGYDLSSDAGTYVAMENTTTPVIIGAQLLDFSTPQYFDGSIDELGIWTRALTASEVLEHYTKTNSGLSYPNW